MKIAPPIDETSVTLTHLKDADGVPVVVRLRRLDALECGEIIGQLPGEVPANPSGEVMRRSASEGMALARQWVIRASVEPRFIDSQESQNGDVPVAWLGQGDLGALAEAAMELAGVRLQRGFRNRD